MNSIYQGLLEEGDQSQVSTHSCEGLPHHRSGHSQPGALATNSTPAKPCHIQELSARNCLKSCTMASKIRYYIWKNNMFFRDTTIITSPRLWLWVYIKLETLFESGLSPLAYPWSSLCFFVLVLCPVCNSSDKTFFTYKS